MWVFHGNEDPTVPGQRLRNMVKGITDAGGYPKYTEYPGIGHGALTPTYNDPKVWDWLFAQEKK
ncbi:hypothetical protein OCK74_26530 [Chitinophagaceae bacterium LB-8]|jgi:predicted peptidase|uniref:Peptidase S9 prolyl oligopeptidase catalytic domain-containing protein n=1 Tax=Paraflavisolibacter caeni TaxID=2982496 RepID=A0A9X2XQ56_9BACT|nr:hypothetical protein [Paraflavisolibacter caeni]MCU7552704.1 hypothetical protein [Paraflavisolibacter caeni]